LYTLPRWDFVFVAEYSREHDSSDVTPAADGDVKG